MNKALKQFELSTNNDFDLIKDAIRSIDRVESGVWIELFS